MAKALVVSASASIAREAVGLQIRHVVAEPGVSTQIRTCFRHHACFNKRFLSSSLQVSNTYDARYTPNSTKWSIEKRSSQSCQPSSSFFTVLPEGLCRRSKRRSKKLMRRNAKNKDGGPFIDSQWLPPAAIGAEGKPGSVGCSKVEVVQDDDDESGDRVLEDQFNRFTMAMALQDSEMAQQIMQEMGDSDRGETTGLANEVPELQDQLQQLYGEVLKLIEEGDDDTARALIEANYENVVEQLESGYKSIEQIAMLDILAQLRMSLGEFEEAEYLLDQTKDLMEAVGIDPKQPLVDRILEHVGSMYTALGKPSEGLPFYLKSVEIQEHLLGEESTLIVKTLLGLASTLTDMDDTIRAIGVYRRVLLIIEKNKGPTDESLALPLSHLGHCLLEEGRVDEAELALLRALKLVEQTFGARDGRVGIAKCALARAKAARGAVDESVSLYRGGLQVMEECSKFVDDDPSLETVRTDLAELLNMMERHDEAEELWERNLQAKERVIGLNDPALVVHLQNLATAYAVSGKYEECVPLLRRSLKLTTANLGPNAPQVSVPLECLATALHHTGRQYEAEPLARQALHIREAAFGADSAIVGKLHLPMPSEAVPSCVLVNGIVIISKR
ncbi:hypothetical protein M758_5G057300 [Ceratodon purpureus]|nr:hypothetical protein M758_5G057300 [Ceratodon purpureus]